MENALISTAHQRFISLMLEGQEVLDAAEIAGFDRTNAHRDALTPVLIPAVRAMGRKYVKGRIDIEGAPAAYRFFMWVLRKPDAPLTARLEAAKVLLNHSVSAPKAEAEGADTEKTPSEMSNEELSQWLRAADTEAVNRGLIKVVEHQPLDDII